MTSDRPGPASVPAIDLGGGVRIPQLGFGVFQIPAQDTKSAVLTAIESGYRHIDTAAMYENEDAVGAAIRESGLAREEVFVTTKCNNPDQGYEPALRGFEASAAELDLDYVDLYLIHWPLPLHNQYIETWRAFEKLQSDGRVRAIGVSNFQVAHLDRVIDETGVVPAVNQIELHPLMQQPALRAANAQRGIVTEAWSPLARGGDLLSDPVLTKIAAKHGKTAAQVILRWHLDLGNIVIPRSVTPSRVAENFDIFDFALDNDDLDAIGGLDRGARIGPDPDVFNGN
ncbi:diketogulonate reductase-like aldo/keto reductase [Antricoccus suffuscus]|uniref:Diketogulonate reductase-like aldo/keto reductase n=1 Tax=Antricoccus suffuscus TaxID=1629062 RepID=A0A2T0Z028_9ACTN|nr:aldo/keto reductase [Antricoccus suffuscus]PRZ29707.1 diketogulonate reductase-like aldo/keto reductase [Antricoccus suffuscus]